MFTNFQMFAKLFGHVKKAWPTFEALLPENSDDFSHIKNMQF